MWRDFSRAYLKNNRTSGISVMIAAFISAILLSLLCSVFYNFWAYDIDRLKSEEGAWQGRIAGEIDEEDMAAIQNYGNVKKAVLNERLSDGQEVVIDIYFQNMRNILNDMPRLAELAGLSPEAVSYHHSLLNMYLIRDPKDTAPRLVFSFALGVIVLACASLIMIIHNSFAVSMNARIHQFGILSSVGATPGQIRTCLLQEAAALCLIPIIAGNFLGIVSSIWIIRQTNVLAVDVEGRHEAVWAYHPYVFIFTLVITVLTIWISVWLPARKMSRLTPLEAIKNTGDLQVKKQRDSKILLFLFGVEGELAGNALKAQRKALRTASLSLIFSFMAFTLMLCFFTLTGISQRMTYFEKYQDVWDIMVTVPNEEIESFEETDKIQALSGIRSAVIYQKADAKRLLKQDEISGELAAAGGFSYAPPSYVTETKDGFLVNAPIVVLDDASFLDYCEQIGTPPQLNGTVILNQIYDVTDPDFRNRARYDYVTGQQKASVLRRADQEETAVEIPVIAYAKAAPVLREEYGTLDLYELVHFLPVSLWQKIKGQIEGSRNELHIRILADETATLEDLNALQSEVREIISPNDAAVSPNNAAARSNDAAVRSNDTVVSENRIQDKINNDKMIRGMMMLLGGLCALLASIGIGNVFANALGFARQRKREFARYMSIGLTPGGLRKMFCIEALVITARPVLITLPVTATAVGFMLKLSYLEPMIFIREAPVIPIFLFILAILSFVALAYYISWKKMARVSLTEALRDDTMI